MDYFFFLRVQVTSIPILPLTACLLKYLLMNSTCMREGLLALRVFQVDYFYFLRVHVNDGDDARIRCFPALLGAAGLGQRGGRDHGERSRLQLLFKLAGTATAALHFWLGRFGGTNVADPVTITVF